MKNYQTMNQVSLEVSTQQQSIQNFGDNSTRVRQVQTASTGSFLAKVQAENGKLVLGMTESPAVHDLQQFLLDNGYPIIEVDGWFGNNTAKAVRMFQQDHNLYVDGWIGIQSASYIDGLMGSVGTQVEAPVQDTGSSTAEQESTPTENPSTEVGTSLMTAPEPWIRFGARGSNVVDLQNALVACGHDVGPVDGIYGNMTTAGLKAFQSGNGLSNDGAYGPVTAAKLREVLAGGASSLNTGSQQNSGQTNAGATETETPNNSGGGTSSNGVLPEPWLVVGDDNDNVAMLQTQLNILGYNVGNPDGEFGPRTLTGLSAFQAAYGLGVDGEYGPATKNMMQRALNGEVEPLPNATTAPVTGADPNGSMSSAIGWSLTQQGAPYYGGRSPYRDGHAPGNGEYYQQQGQERYLSELGVIGYDCSGFVTAVYRQAGIELGPRNTTWLESTNQFTTVSKSAMQPGDIIVQGGRHVVIFIGNGQVVQSTPPEVIVSSVSNYLSNSAYIARRYAGFM